MNRSGIAPQVRQVYVEPDRPLRRVLAFTRHSIDDVVNSPVAKAQVLLVCGIK